MMLPTGPRCLYARWRLHTHRVPRPAPHMRRSRESRPCRRCVPADRERYQALTANPVKLVAEAPVSTFSIDVDTGSYANVRRFLNQGRLPPADAVRVEELINYFPYDYGLPSARTPFAVHTELAAAPWNSGNVLLRIAIKGQDLAKQSLPPANLVFLVDVSGSMTPADKLPLLKASLKLLVKELRAQDRITLVTYAGQTAVILQPTAGNETNRILAAIDSLTPGGSTAGASGIELAYSMAQQSFIPAASIASCSRPMAISTSASPTSAHSRAWSRSDANPAYRCPPSASAPAITTSS